MSRYRFLSVIASPAKSEREAPTGSLLFARDQVHASGEEARYTRPSDSGFDITFRFCPNCGSTVLWEPSRKPETIAVAVGAFADPTFPTPSKAVYEEHRHRWVEMTI